MSIRLKALSLAVLLTTCLPAQAEPRDGQVRSGQAQINAGPHTVIQQLTDKAIIDWNQFSIGRNESVTFFQPGVNSVVLNRVTGVLPSQILGELQANGSVLLINRNGILFGPESRLNVGGVVASSLDIDNEDFLAGQYKFANTDGTLASVINQGRIEVTDGGFAVLLSQNSQNQGEIIARSGRVLLANGERATLNFDGRDLIHYTVSSDQPAGLVVLPNGQVSRSLSSTFGVPSSRQANAIVRDSSGQLRLVNRRTLNQGNPPLPVTVVLTPEETEVTTSVRVQARNPDPEIFVQNNPRVVEDVLRGVQQLSPNLQNELDPTRIPTVWFDDQDFMQRKFRR